MENHYKNLLERILKYFFLPDKEENQHLSSVHDPQKEREKEFQCESLKF